MIPLVYHAKRKFWSAQDQQKLNSFDISKKKRNEDNTSASVNTANQRASQEQISKIIKFMDLSLVED